MDCELHFHPFEVADDQHIVTQEKGEVVKVDFAELWCNFGWLLPSLAPNLLGGVNGEREVEDQGRVYISSPERMAFSCSGSAGSSQRLIMVHDMQQMFKGSSWLIGGATLILRCWKKGGRLRSSWSRLGSFSGLPLHL